MILRLRRVVKSKEESANGMQKSAGKNVGFFWMKEYNVLVEDPHTFF